MGLLFKNHITSQTLFGLGAILILTIIVFFPVLDYDFVNWDDPAVVQENSLIQQGFTSEMVTTAFSNYNNGLYSPVTQLSYALDFTLFGLKPGDFHRTNLIIHLFNIVLVFYLLLQLFRRQDIAIVVALLFAIHPTQVEPVAWITSRKDVLYLFWMLLSWIAYLGYSSGNRNKKGLLALSALLFLLSLMSKVSAIVFPAFLLATDYLQEGKITRKQLAEKIPFFLLAGLFVIIGIWTQKAEEAIPELDASYLLKNIVYGFYAFIHYPLKALVPIQLAAFHPYPSLPDESLPWYVIASIPLSLLLVYGGYRIGKQHRNIAFGLLLFFFGIFPFLQFLPVGQAIIAERFSYFPTVGLFIGAFFIGEILWKKGGFSFKNQYASYVAILALALVLGFFSRQQVSSWKNGETLWSKVMEVYPESPLAFINRAGYYLDQNDLSAAFDDLNTSIELGPGFAPNYNNRGMIYMEQQEFGKAIADFQKCLKLEPDYAKAHMNIGLIGMNTGKYEDALKHFNSSIQLDSTFFEAYYNRGYLNGILRNYEAAVTDFSKAISIKPNQAIIYKDRAVAYFLQKQYDKSIQDYNRSIELAPKQGEIYMGRSQVFFDLGNLEAARQDAVMAQQLGVTIPEDYADKLR